MGVGEGKASQKLRVCASTPAPEEERGFRDRFRKGASKQAVHCVKRRSRPWEIKTRVPSDAGRSQRPHSTKTSAMSTRVLLLALASSAHAQEYMQVGLDAAGRQDNMPGVMPPEPQFFAGAGAMAGPPMGVGGVPGGGGFGGGVPGGGGFGGGAPEMPMMGGAGMMGGFGGMPAQQQGYAG